MNRNPKLTIIGTCDVTIETAQVIPSREEVNRVFDQGEGVDDLLDETFHENNWKQSPVCKPIVPGSRELVLVKFDQMLTRTECIEEMQKHGLHPALPSDAWAFAKDQKEKGATHLAMILVFGADILYECALYTAWLYRTTKHTYRFSLIGFDKPFSEKTLYLAVK